VVGGLLLFVVIEMAFESAQPGHQPEPITFLGATGLSALLWFVSLAWSVSHIKRDQRPMNIYVDSRRAIVLPPTPPPSMHNVPKPPPIGSSDDWLDNLS
jgi:hypothetical protein